MQDISADLFRGSVTGLMNAIFLFVLAKPKYSKSVTIFAVVFVFLADILTSFYFYFNHNLTALAKFDLFLFIGLMIFLKPFVKDKILPWIFNCITATNVMFIIVFISYHLCDFFPYPYYSNTVLRLLLYLLIIWLFIKYVSPLYQQVIDNWKIYALIIFSILMNFMYYIISAEDIEETLTEEFIPLSLLIFMSILIYITILYFQQKSIANYLLLKEKQHYKELAYLDILTGIQNRNGYENYISNIMKMNCKNICIGIYDINDLKTANDSLGHDFGDKLIFQASRIICMAFKNCAVFRIGGDEFVSVSINSSEKELEMKHEEMLRLLKDYNSTNPSVIELSIAFGYAIQSAPFSLDMLFTEADNNMYQNKTNMKEHFN